MYTAGGMYVLQKQVCYLSRFNQVTQPLSQWPSRVTVGYNAAMDMQEDADTASNRRAAHRYRSATGLNIRELLVFLMLGFFSLLFLALPWLIVLVEGPGAKSISLALGVDIAMVLFMWSIFGLGLWIATKRPARGVERASRDALRERLLNLNHAESLFVLTEVAPYHLVGRWKLDVPDYLTLFGKHGLTELYQLNMYLKPDGRVAALETRGTVRWNLTAVPPRASYNWSFFRGIVLYEFKLDREWALDRDLKFRRVVDFTFNADEYKRPVVEMIVGSGWVFRPILFKPLRWKGE